MKKVIRLTENDLIRLVKRVINENINVTLKVGDRVEVSNLESRPGYMPNSPNKVISFMGTVCKIGTTIIIKTDSGKCSEILNKSEYFWKDKGYIRIYYPNLREPSVCDKWDC